MTRAEMKNAPSLNGWIFAGMIGTIAFAALMLVGDFDFFPAAFLAALVAGVAGLIVGMPWGQDPGRPAAAPAAEVAHAPAAAPVVAAAAAATDAVQGDGPLRLSAPRGGLADDLKEIEGIGPALEKLVNELGFFHFDQIANWSEADVAWVDANLKGFKGRVSRDKWVAQAKIIVGDGLEVFRQRAKTNDY